MQEAGTYLMQIVLVLRLRIRRFFLVLGNLNGCVAGVFVNLRVSLHRAWAQVVCGDRLVVVRACEKGYRTEDKSLFVRRIGRMPNFRHFP